jgi:hypothetical protein
MKWIVIIVVAGFLYYYFVLVKHGKLKFWKFAKNHPEDAYSFFIRDDSFVVFDSKPPGGYRANLPSGEWDGPFRLHVPSKNRIIIIFGRVPEYLSAQEKFRRTQNA